ncbi:MAG TPA: glycoside hydrolase family 97 C-terminal domain-containing protein [Clostridia bacterium]|nr:glycoside hydrolase family 97 C-terminal domain-containing protein [Clostridia bacterium]
MSDYLREPEITQFMARIPTLWEETRVLSAKLADYVVLLRQSGPQEYYVGAMTDWTARDLDLDCAFLGSGEWRAEIWEDGLNADQYGNDFRRRVEEVNHATRMKIHMAPGGGYVARFTRQGNSSPPSKP